MTTERRRALGCARGALVGLGIAGCLGLATLPRPASAKAEATASAADPAATRAAMREIFAAMEVLLPLSADDASFASAKNANEIRRALKVVAERIHEVGIHAETSDRSVHYLSTALEREAAITRDRYERGQVESAQFFVQRMTDFCVACHSRLPSEDDSPLARSFVSDGALAVLPPAERAVLQIATRRFDDGLTTLEGVITSPEIHPAELLEPVTRYLKVSIRVKHDLQRPIPTLEKLANRADLWRHLRSDVKQWIASLRAHQLRPSATPSLDSARRHLEEARNLVRFPSDRRALVEYLLASSELHRYVTARPGADDRDMAEAYYWLGLIETRVDTDYWVSEADFYLETAIRIAPRDPVAQNAYDLLEEEAVLGWTGSGGVNVPPDVQSRLDELRELIDSSQTGDNASLPARAAPASPTSARQRSR